MEETVGRQLKPHNLSFVIDAPNARIGMAQREVQTTVNMLRLQVQLAVDKLRQHGACVRPAVHVQEM